MTKVLLTGASGFIAMHVLQQLLAAGYTVKATVRSQAKADFISKTFAAQAEKIEFSIVPDIAAPNAFDEAVVGVDMVVHTASPFHFKVTDPVKDLLDPAMKGTLNILNAIKTYAPQVTRLVLTSSFAAIVNAAEGAWPGHVYTEADWNPVTWEEATTTTPQTTYRASKTFAERSAWDFIEREKPNFTLTTINPPLVWGPMLHEADLSSLNTSNNMVYNMISGATPEVPVGGQTSYVDVRNVAAAHVRALTTPAAVNQRYFVVGGKYTNSQVIGLIGELFPAIKDKLPKCPPGVLPAGLDAEFGVDGSKATRDMGIEYVPLEKSLTDLVTQLLEWQAKA
ncbi:uncharacterized protein V1510DRAFT_420119 [Dipodascopsis tothii]|uniref:uncharacterized protein n=1 Tax=Dipodascopsis tothii TaxID=44089 RepID=UPI0034CDAEC8